jgi:hypothetical protein
VVAIGPTTTVRTDGATETTPETAATANATTVRATTAGTGRGTATTDGIARAPETEATVDAPALPDAIGATTGAMQTWTGTGRGIEAIGGGTTIGWYPNGSAVTGA